MARTRKYMHGRRRRCSPLKSGDEKKDERTENQKAIDEAIDKGYVPKPNTKKLLKQFKKVYFDEKLV